MALEQAIHELENAADDTSATTNPNAWRTGMRDLLQRVRASMTEPLGSRDGWLVARAQHAERDRCALLDRISAMTKRVAESRSAHSVQPDVRRLARDLSHYRRRLGDLNYDSVELELGGFD